LATSASLISLSSSIRHPNNKVFNLRSVFLPQNNGLRKGFSCSGLKWKPEKRSDQVSIRCKAAVAEKESTDTSGEKFEYQAEVGFVLFCETWNLFEVLRIGSWFFLCFSLILFSSQFDLLKYFYLFLLVNDWFLWFFFVDMIDLFHVMFSLELGFCFKSTESWEI
jgi:hypothetical protein